MAYKFSGIEERLEQLKSASDHVAYRGLKALDRLITIELDENPDCMGTLLTYRRMCRMQLRSIANRA